MKSTTLSQNAIKLAVGIGLAAAATSAQAQSVDIFMKPAVVTPEPNGVITSDRTRALHLFAALTGVSIAIDDPRLKSMEAYLKAGNTQAAEAIATDDPLFYNNRVVNLAAKMSTRDESPRAPFSDMIATFVGIVRDSDTTPATQMLTGNFFYMADNTIITANGGTAVPSNLSTDVLTLKGTHFAQIKAQNLSLKAVLKRVDGQMYLPAGTGGTPAAHPDPAGLITSVAFIGAHATMGTNRRMVEYSYREFMCTPMANWADGTSPDDKIGRDVDRMPGGSPNKFLTTCKNCHANMDGQRGAFGFLDYDDNNQIPTFNTAGVVVPKMLRNATVYPAGYKMTDNSFVNYSNVGNNADQFGWRSAAMSGKGIGQFAAALSKSQGFSRCMVRRVFTDVCKRAPAATEESMVRSMADQFELSNYHMKHLFENVAIRPECGVNN